MYDKTKKALSCWDKRNKFTSNGFQMNFLAHAYLSGEDELTMIGNITGDTIRGSQLIHIPKRMQNGVILHREIDAFTDNHPLVKHCKLLLRSHFNKYSGVAVDVYFDHFLSVNWEKYSDRIREVYIKDIYNHLQIHSHLLPEKSRLFTEFMIRYNWLDAYYSVEGISQIMLQMDNRSKFETGFKNARSVLEAHYSELDKGFNEFFPELIDFSKNHPILNES